VALGWECVPHAGCTNCDVSQFRAGQKPQLKILKSGALGHGLFAVKDISQGSVIVEGIGIYKMEAPPDDYPYALEFALPECQKQDGYRLFLDMGSHGGKARFINHSCGSSNAEVRQLILPSNVTSIVVSVGAFPSGAFPFGAIPLGAFHFGTIIFFGAFPFGALPFGTIHFVAFPFEAIHFGAFLFEE